MAQRLRGRRNAAEIRAHILPADVGDRLPATAADGTENASNRLTTVFHDLVESALQQRLHGLVEGLAAKMESRIAEIETAGVTRVEQRITDVVSLQGECLEKRASEIVSSRQSALEEDIRQYFASQEETARRAQHRGNS